MTDSRGAPFIRAVVFEEEGRAYIAEGILEDMLHVHGCLLLKWCDPQREHHVGILGD